MKAVREVLRETRDDRLAEALLIVAQRRIEADRVAIAREAARVEKAETDALGAAVLVRSATYSSGAPVHRTRW